MLKLLELENTTFLLPEEKRTEKSTKDVRMDVESVAIACVKLHKVRENGYNVSLIKETEERKWKNCRISDERVKELFVVKSW